MTAAEMLKTARMYFGDDEGSDGRKNSQLWAMHFKNAADNLARRKYCFWVREYTDIVANQSEYCTPPNIFRLNAITVRDSTGKTVRPMATYQPSQMDLAYPYWRSEPDSNPSGIPSVIVLEALQRFKLWRIPNYDYTSGLVFEGFGIPGDMWLTEIPADGETPAVPVNWDDECPLPNWAHEAVLFGAMVNRFIERPPATAEKRDQRDEIRRQYESLAGQVERNAATYGQACQSGGYGSLTGPWYGYWGY